MVFKKLIVSAFVFIFCFSIAYADLKIGLSNENPNIKLGEEKLIGGSQNITNNYYSNGSYNATYDTWLPNYTAYGKFWYNQTYPGSTYNATYDTWLPNYTAYGKFWYNQTYPGSTYNATYDTWLPNYTAYGKFWYNMTDGWNYNQTLAGNNLYLNLSGTNDAGNIFIKKANVTFGDGDKGIFDYLGIFPVKSQVTINTSYNYIGLLSQGGDGTAGLGVVGIGKDFGIYGSSETIAVYGKGSNIGIYGVGVSSYAVYGESINEDGIYGKAQASEKAGIKGETSANDGRGVLGEGGEGETSVSVYANAGHYGIYQDGASLNKFTSNTQFDGNIEVALQTGEFSNPLVVNGIGNFTGGSADILIDEVAVKQWLYNQSGYAQDYYVPYNSSTQHINLNNKRILNINKIGIGTGTDITNPNRAIEIRDNSAGQITINSTNSNRYSGIVFISNYNQQAVIGVGGQNTTSGQRRANNTFISSDNDILLEGGGNTEGLRVKSDGDVGIGNNNPSLALNVNNSAVNVAEFRSSSTAGSTIIINSTATGGGQWELISSAGSTSIGGGKFGIIGRTSQISNYWMVINGTNGFIGINTSSPAYPIDIRSNGTSGISLYASNTISALAYIDRTTFPDESYNALEKVMSIKSDGAGQLDHSTLSDYAKADIQVPVYETQLQEVVVDTKCSMDSKTGAETCVDIKETKPVKVLTGYETQEGRNIGNQLSELIKAVQEQQVQIEQLKKEICKLNPASEVCK